MGHAHAPWINAYMYLNHPGISLTSSLVCPIARVGARGPRLYWFIVTALRVQPTPRPHKSDNYRHGHRARSASVPTDAAAPPAHAHSEMRLSSTCSSAARRAR